MNPKAAYFLVLLTFTLVMLALIGCEIEYGPRIQREPAAVRLPRWPGQPARWVEVRP